MSATPTNDTADLQARIRGVRARIEAAASAAGRDPADVRLVAVSKTHPPAACLDVLAAGLSDLGENRVQELDAKSVIVDRDAAAPPTWHLIGPLQSNKVKDVVDRGWWLHGIDRAKLVRRVGDQSTNPSDQPVLIQVNIGKDPAKAGCAPSDAAGLVDLAVDAGLDVRGLMTIVPLPGPDADPAAAARPHFAALRELRDRLRVDHPGLRELSMGMTDDLDAAVAEGATIVRVGTAIFGPRGAAAWSPSSLAATPHAVDDPENHDKTGGAP